MVVYFFVITVRALEAKFEAEEEDILAKSLNNKMRLKIHSSQFTNLCQIKRFVALPRVYCAKTN